MIIQINEIKKNYFNDYVIMNPISEADVLMNPDDETEMIKEWQKVYGFAVTVKKINIYNVMKDMDNWSWNNFNKSCYFEFD